MTAESRTCFFRAPGRVNLIGEHTDYNDGFVLPVAIQLQTRVAATPVPERKLHARSELYSEEITFDLDAGNQAPRRHWSDYIHGVARSLEQEGLEPKGARLLIESDIPPGAGLSSSAALEVATAFALLTISGFRVDPLRVAQICRRAENEFVGIRSGLMDQFAACFGQRNRAMLLDCRSLEVRHVPVPEHVALMVSNTMVRHELASSQYNSRRRDCETGVTILSKFLPGVRALRDVTSAQLDRYRGELDPLIHRRCRHVIEENQRVLDAVQALVNGDLTQVGALLIQSHRSLRLDYEVSCPELDLMCELALGLKGVYGARMIGGGFGGCVLALVERTVAATFRQAILTGYRERTGIECEVYECFAADGASPLG